MFYLVKTIKTEAGLQASVPSIPELEPVTVKTEEEATKKLATMLPTVLQTHYRKTKRPVPFPNDDVSDQLAVQMPIKVQAKILLWNYMLENRYRVADLARLLKISHPQAQRLVDFDREGASLDAIEDALFAIGAYFELTLRKFD